MQSSGTHAQDRSKREKEGIKGRIEQQPQKTSNCTYKNQDQIMKS